MANVRINKYENWKMMGNMNIQNGSFFSSLMCHMVVIPGSISFNNVAIIASQTIGAFLSGRYSVSFGLYSLNGSTLSLANSASAASDITLNQSARSWLTMITSATQDITPGNWYFAFIHSSASSGSHGYMARNAKHNLGVNDNSAYGGPFFDGYLSVSTGAMPASIATSDMIKDEATANEGITLHPYILITS